MFEYLYEWIRNLSFYMILVMVVIQILPNKEYKKYIRFFTGLVLILLMMTPIFKIFGMDYNLTDIYNAKSYQAEIKRIEEATKYLEEIEPEEYLKGEESQEEQMEVEEIRIGR